MDTKELEDKILELQKELELWKSYKKLQEELDNIKKNSPTAIPYVPYTPYIPTYPVYPQWPEYPRWPWITWVSTGTYTVSSNDLRQSGI